MSDTAINAYVLLGGETVQFVLQTLAAAAQDAKKAEAALFIWEQMADFQTDTDEPAIAALLSNAQALNLDDNQYGLSLFESITKAGISSIPFALSNAHREGRLPRK